MDMENTKVQFLAHIHSRVNIGDGKSTWSQAIIEPWRSSLPYSIPCHKNSVNLVLLDHLSTDVLHDITEEKI